MLAFLKEYNTPQEKAFLALVIIALCQNTLFIYPVAAISHFGPLSGLSSFIFPITYFVLFFISIQGLIITKHIRLRDFLLLLFFAVYILVSYTLSIDQSIAISDALETEILPCLPFFFIGICLKIDKMSFETIGKWCCLAVFLTSVYRIFYQNPEEAWDYSYNMGAAYSLLANILITIAYLFHTPQKIIPAICSLIGIFYLLGMGTRGPFMIMLALFILCVFLYSNVKFAWKIIIMISGIIITTLFSVPTLLGDLGWISNLLSSFGLSTRIIDYTIANEVISETSGRDDIYMLLLSKMDDMPFLGYGVLGEYQFDVLYAHNLYLQALFDYGYFFGFLILAFLVILSTKSFLKTKGTITQKWLLVWIVFVFVRGFFGGGVLSMEVFMLMGTCLRTLRLEQSEIQ